MRLLSVALLTLVLSTAAITQSLPVFEVASVKANGSGVPLFMLPILQPNGRVRATNVALHDLIRIAYDLQDNQIEMSSPLEKAGFDIDAGNAETPEQAVLMLRSLLADRFKLQFHRETRSLPVYNLVRVSGSRLGPELRASGPACAPIKPPAGQGGPPPPPPPAAGARGRPLGSNRMFADCLTMIHPAGMSARSMDMEALATAISRSIGRPVINRTGLTGKFDVDLNYAPDLGGPPGAPPPVSNAPALPTALQEQLGLKLESGRAPIEVLVIDSVQAPTDN
jgi:uncharacterized protein (TIGR03435 family)